MTVDHGQHHRTETELRGLIENGATIDQESQHVGLAAPCGDHQTGVTIPVSRVDVHAGAQQLPQLRDIASLNTFQPLRLQEGQPGRLISIADTP